ncbi:ribosome biogenesis protein [Candidatus Parvarchaeota archaeon]|nr:ribosome biogenesis protein [Candidatus Parvarchaeota archaeon]
MKKLRKCALCKSYTMKQEHCGAQTKSAHPPKFKITDKYAKYRRMQEVG